MYNTLRTTCMTIATFYSVQMDGPNIEKPCKTRSTKPWKKLKRVVTVPEYIFCIFWV